MRNFFRLATSFVIRNLKNPLYIFRYAYAFPQRVFSNEASFLSDQELVEALESGKSLLRFGDGEIYMMNFGSIPQYEPYNSRLRKYFFKIINDYKSTSPYIIGIPTFVNDSNEKLHSQGKLNVWLPLKILYRFVFPHNVQYFDAHLFYREGGFERSLNLILKKYRVIVVTRAFNIQLMKDAGIEEKLDVSFIETPERESFRLVPQLLNEVLSLIGGNKELYRVALATGPASKVLVYELSKLGIVSYDIGRGIEAVYRKNEIEHFI